ncbi:class I SAM-dependent methyltransferase [bacterium]|nr:class I SAM-dependent methyltransferase [bacterium]
MEGKQTQPYYGYRASKRMIAALAAAGTVCVVLAIALNASGHSTAISTTCWVLAVVLFAAGFLWYLAFGFMTDPGKTERFHDNLAWQLEALWDGRGKVLDIGTGLGRAAVEIAKRFPEAHVVGVDTWTKKWEFWGMSESGARRTAEAEGVSDRCAFVRADAGMLPFETGEFELVVSSFAFHEIKVPDRTALLKEVVRVLRPGGVFLICDTFGGGFLNAYRVESMPQLVQKVQDMGVEEGQFVDAGRAGVDLGGLTRFWRPGYLTGRKSTAH